MATSVVTSQPVLTSHLPSAVSDKPPSYEEVISKQPKLSPFNLAVDDVEVNPIAENEHSDVQLGSEQEDNKCDNCEEQRRRNIHRHSDCCCVCYVDNDPGWWICCRLFSDCCICLADCTESCCDNCANCLQFCCESNGAEANDDCCHDCCSDAYFCGCDCDSSD